MGPLHALWQVQAAIGVHAVSDGTIGQGLARGRLPGLAAAKACADARHGRVDRALRPEADVGGAGALP
eukprot:5170352-Lingulodinium_polyedra.AAC.1